VRVSVLLLSPGRDIGVALVQRLVAQNDEVRVIESDSDLTAVWKELGAFVATGHVIDIDLIERAGQNVRTIVAVDPDAAGVDAAIEGARLAGIGRLVVCAPVIDEGTRAALQAAGAEYVALGTGASKRLSRRRRALSPDAIAEAIDAADDLGGSQRIELNLMDANAWEALGLESP
jgi:hypothetical protein